MTTKAIAVLMLTLTFAGSTFLVPFGGFDPGQFPVPQDNPPVQPAGYAFAIWGVIYLWLIVMAGFGVWKRATDGMWDRTRAPLVLSLAVGSVWLPVASRSAEWATVLIWIMLGAALIAVMRVRRRDIWTLGVPLGLYAGWLTAASSVSVGLILAGYGVTSETVAAVIGLALAIAIALPTTLRLAVPKPYAAAAIWALAAIVVQNAEANLLVASIAAVGIACVALALFSGRRLAGAAG